MFALLSEKLEPGEVRKIVACLPQPIRALWPSARPQDGLSARGGGGKIDRSGLTLLQWGMIVTLAGLLGTSLAVWSVSAGPAMSSLVLAAQGPVELGPGIARVVLALLGLSAIAVVAALGIGLVLHRRHDGRAF